MHGRYQVVVPDQHIFASLLRFSVLIRMDKTYVLEVYAPLFI